MTTGDDHQPDSTDPELALNAETVEDLDPENDSAEVIGGNRPSMYGPAC
jgi:hypothetical protein